jgi:hypothetical protein
MTALSERDGSAGFAWGGSFSLMVGNLGKVSVATLTSVSLPGPVVTVAGARF